MGLIGIPSQWNYTGDFVTRPAATQAKLILQILKTGFAAAYIFVFDIGHPVA